jgi:acetaldehyde dehydrogenase (acetylating)
MIPDVTEKYPEAVALVGLAESVWKGNKQAARVDFALSDKLKVELQMLMGKDVENVFITDSDARHIKKNHGQKEALRGQVDITPADFAIIPFVMNEFDTAEIVGADNLGNKKILFTKQVNGNVYTVSVERGNNQVGVITLWKNARSGA